MGIGGKEKDLTEENKEQRRKKTGCECGARADPQKQAQAKIILTRFKG
jgi:hypothetical protein